MRREDFWMRVTESGASFNYRDAEVQTLGTGREAKRYIDGIDYSLGNRFHNMVENILSGENKQILQLLSTIDATFA